MKVIKLKDAVKGQKFHGVEVFFDGMLRESQFNWGGTWVFDRIEFSYRAANGHDYYTVYAIPTGSDDLTQEFYKTGGVMNLADHEGLVVDESR